MFAQDLNPIVLGLMSLLVLVSLAQFLRSSLSFEDTTVEARDLAPETIDTAELTTLLAHGDRANALLHELRDLAIAHFEADPDKDLLTPAQVFHLANDEKTKTTFDAFSGEFDEVLRLTRKYKLALDQKTQRSIQKIYFAWDPGGNAIQVKTGDRLWRTDVRSGIDKLLGVS